MLGEKDFKNLLQIVEFCVKQEFFLHKDLIKGIMNDLLLVYDANSYKY